MKGVTFTRSIQVLQAEHSVPMLLFCGLWYPRKGHQTLNSFFDVSEVDLGMQMRFLRAAPCTRQAQCVGPMNMYIFVFAMYNVVKSLYGVS